MFGLGIPEIIVIGIILLLIFGANRLPSIGEGLGKTIKELRNAKREFSSINKSAVDKEIAVSSESEEQKENPSDEFDSAEGRSSENDIVDSVQQQVTKQVADKILEQVPGIKRAKQLKDKADQIKKIVS